MKLRLILIISSVFSIISTSIYANEITGMFSSFKLSKKSGDIIGVELHIMPAPTGYKVVVQASEGAPGYPEIFELTIDNGNVVFLVPKNSATGLQPGNYIGKVSKKNMLLKGPMKSYDLPRKSSYWQ